MSFAKLFHAPAAKKIIAGTIALALAAAPLSACGGQQGQDGADSSDSSSQAATVDSSSWKTLGDALAAQTSSFASGYDDDYYVTVFEADGSYFRVVAKMNADAKAKIDAIDWSKDIEEVNKETDEAVSGLEIQSVEDLTDKYLTQDMLDAYVGKTGKELEEAGFEFQDYGMYGGEGTGANYAKDYLVYMFTFDVSISEDDTEDGGVSVADAKVVEAEFYGAANAATDPTQVQ